MNLTEGLLSKSREVLQVQSRQASGPIFQLDGILMYCQRGRANSGQEGETAMILAKLIQELHDIPSCLHSLCASTSILEKACQAHNYARSCRTIDRQCQLLAGNLFALVAQSAHDLACMMEPAFMRNDTIQVKDKPQTGCMICAESPRFQQWAGDGGIGFGKPSTEIRAEAPELHPGKKMGVPIQVILALHLPAPRTWA